MVFDAHDKAFAFFGGACARGIYDNMKTAVDAIFVGKDRAWAAAAPGPLIEAAVVAARCAAGETSPPNAGAQFLPVALGGAGGLRWGGTADDRLRRWIDGAHHATRAALRRLDALRAWEARAQQIAAPRSGRVPPLLITLLRDWPVLSAPMAAAETGASRAAVQRNLNWMTRQGLIREMTGQGRYRFWTAML